MDGEETSLVGPNSDEPTAETSKESQGLTAKELGNIPKTSESRTHTMRSDRLKAPRHKTSQLIHFFQNLSLGGCFRLLGEAIGTYPLAFLISSIILCSLSFGIIRLHLRDNVRDGFTPSTSAARHETEVYKQFLDSAGDPQLTTVLLKANDGGSMHRLEHMKEAVAVIEHIKNKLNATYHEEHVKYMQFCGSYCNANDVVGYFYQALEDKTANPNRSHILNYPVTRLMGYDIHMERNFFGVETNDSLEISNIQRLNLIVAIFMGEMRSSADERRMAAWEMAVFDYSIQYKGLVEVLVLGSEIVDVEMNRDAQRMAPYFVVGFLSMFCFVCSTVYFSSLYFDKLSWYTVVIALACTIVPVMAITTTLGMNSIAGFRTNQLLLIMPFLIMGIGVNDSFLTVHAWLRLKSSDSIAVRLGMVFEEVGPSITTTTLTNVVTFLISALTPTQEISLFCFGTAIALGFAYIYTLILFGPILYYASPIMPQISQKTEQGWRKRLDCGLQCIVKWYAKIISNKYVAIFLFSTTLVYWYFALMGTLKIDSRLDTEKILPRETPIRRPNRIIEEEVWTEYYPVTVIINNPVNLSNPNEVQMMHSLQKDFESLPNCRGENYTISWLRTYESYFVDYFENYFDLFSDDVPTEEDFSARLLPGFLNLPLYEHYKSFVKVDKTKSNPVQKSSFLFIYQNSTTWDERIDLVLKWRNIVQRYPALNASIWHVNSMFVDQMLSLKQLALQSGFWTLFCMVIVCALFIQNPASVFLASLAIASISLGTMGYLSFWDLDLDPVTLGAVLMSIGMSVDFTAHTTYHYQLRSHREMRDGKMVTVQLKDPQTKLRHTMVSVAWPMTQAALSTVICILPLILLQNYIPLVFVKTISLVVIWGMWHGLVLLPACLSQIPNNILDINCYRSIFRNASPAPTRHSTVLQESVPLKDQVPREDAGLMI